MTILFYILIVIASLVILFLVVAAFTGKKMIIEKTTTINKPLQEVFDYIRYLKNHQNFNVWTMIDPNMKKEFKGMDGQVGFVYGWDSATNKNVGAGEQEIKSIVEGKSIEHELRFFRPMQNVAIATFQLEPASAGQTRVMWGFYGDMKFPMNAMKSMFQNMLGKQLDTSLQNLKNVMENS